MAQYGIMEKKWVWMLLLGVVFMTLGFAGLMMLPLMTLSSVSVFGAFMLVGGILQVLHGLTKAKDWKSAGVHTLMGLVYVLAGVFTIENPILASATLTLLLGVSFIVIGTLRMGVAFQNKDVNQWPAMVFSGLLTVLLGLFIVLQWPWSSLWAIGLYVSVDLIMSGANFVAIALAAKTAGERSSPA